MISALIPYGGVIYWLLLSFGTLMVTLFALKQEDPLIPTIWASVTAIFAFGFTSYEPSALEVLMGSVAYLIFGVAYSYYRWARLVYNIKMFVQSLPEDLEDRARMAAMAFSPNDVGDAIHLPPNPVEFRTRILMWILFWPSFTLFCSVEKLHTRISTGIWKVFSKVSKSIYDR